MCRPCGLEIAANAVQRKNGLQPLRCKRHLLIAKRHDGIVTRTGVRPLSSDERREEIARMLSGAEITDEARAQARRLIEPA